MSHSDHVSDDQILNQMRDIVARDGQRFANNYEIFLADNATFEAYWADGVMAIAQDSVEELVFGKSCMLAVGREHLASTLTGPEVLMHLAIAFDHAVLAMAKGKAL